MITSERMLRYISDSLRRSDSENTSTRKGSIKSSSLLATAAISIFAGAAAANANTMTFSDGFQNFTWSADGSQGWMTSFPYGGYSSRTLPGNNEAEFYSDPTVGVNPFALHNNTLTITAQPAWWSGTNSWGLPYTSGLITSFTTFHQTYGIFSMRAKLPAGQGLWPAFWLLPSSNLYTSELDVFEVLGGNPTQLFATTHGFYGSNWGVDSQAEWVPNTSDGYHTYTVDWEPNTITFMVDQTVICTAPTPTSMNSPMYMLINLAVGGAGSWPGQPNSSTQFPATMQIQWVRAWASANTRDVGGTRAMVPAGQ